ncbi:MAG: radical SAM protein, partial [Chloroflexi bacterium]|nr:radical SAM protein [Chloroflexota bacterium]
EVARGCGWGCRFCVAGYLFRPMRPRSIERIIEQARNGMQRTDKVGLLGAAAGDYPELDELVTRLHAMGARLSVSSLRVNNLTDALLRSLDRSGARNVTVAPEAGSERLRKFVNKSLSEQDILDSFHKVGRYGIKQYKHYYIVGLPTETDEEAMEIARITLEGRKVIDSYKSATRIVLDISPFIPKAGTAFQWLPMTPLEVTERRLVAIKRALRGKNIEVKWDSPEWSAIDTVLSRGGRELAPVLMRLNGHLTVSSFRRTMAECGLDMDKYVFTSYPVDKPLPWDTVDTGVKKGFFKLELANAYKHKEFGVCPPAGCRACGVC